MLHDNGISISYDRVLEISAQLGDAVVTKYVQDGVVCPPTLRKVQTIFGKINVIVTLRAGPPLKVMDFISYNFFYSHSLIQYYLYTPSQQYQLIAYYKTLRDRLVGEARYLYQTLASGKGSTPQ